MLLKSPLTFHSEKHLRHFPSVSLDPSGPVFPVDQSLRLGRYKLFAPIKTECGLWRGPESFSKGSFWEVLGIGNPASRGICLHRRPRRIHPLGVGGSHGGVEGLGKETANPLTVTTTQVTSEAKSSQYVSPRSFLKVDHEGCPGTYPGP